MRKLKYQAAAFFLLIILGAMGAGFGIAVLVHP